MKRYDWNQYCKQLVAGMRDFRRVALAAVNATALAAPRESSERSSLDSKTRELIALAAAVTLHSERYIALHAANARKLGVAEDEIGQALCVAAVVNAKVTLAHSMRAIHASDGR